MLQGLLAERISIRDLPLILEAIGEALGVTQSSLLIGEHVRTRLARQITGACTAESGFVPIITLSAAWEQAFTGALAGQGDERQLAMAPTELQRFVQALRDALEAHAMRGELPAIVTTPCDPTLRPLRGRALPAGDRGPVAERDPSEGEDPNVGTDLSHAPAPIRCPLDRGSHATDACRPG